MPNPYTSDKRPSYPFIKVEDGLPKPYVLGYSEHCLVICENSLNKDRIVWYGFYDPKKNVWHCELRTEPFYGIWYVTHWQYLPALPE